MEYQFRCKICKRKFTVDQRMNDEHVASHCGSRADREWNIVKHRIAFKEGLNYETGQYFSTQRAADEWSAEHNFKRIKS